MFLIRFDRPTIGTRELEEGRKEWKEEEKGEKHTKEQMKSKVKNSEFERIRIRIDRFIILQNV